MTFREKGRLPELLEIKKAGSIRSSTSQVMQAKQRAKFSGPLHKIKCKNGMGGNSLTKMMSNFVLSLGQAI